MSEKDTEALVQLLSKARTQVGALAALDDFASDGSLGCAFDELIKAEANIKLPHPFSNPPAGVSKHHWQCAIHDARLCERFLILKKTGSSGNQAARSIGRPASWFSVHVPVYLREGVIGLIPRYRNSERLKGVK